MAALQVIFLFHDLMEAFPLVQGSLLMGMINIIFFQQETKI